MSKFVKHRESLGLSQRQVAIAVGITDQTVSNWERGIYSPRLSPSQFKSLARVLNLSLDELVELMTCLEEVA